MAMLSIGKSAATDVQKAVSEAVDEALSGAKDPVFALVFTTDQYEADLISEALSKGLGKIPWAGCSTAGVFAGSFFLNQGVAVGVFTSKDLQVGVGLGGPVSKGGISAGQSAVSQALASVPRKDGTSQSLILLTDAITGNASDVVRGATQEAGSGLVWAGGGAGDNLRFVRTAQFAHGRAYHDHVVAIVLQSPRPFSSGVRHGWKPYGPPNMVTRAKESVAFDLDYQPAFNIYSGVATAMGDEVSREGFATFAMTHPLGIPQADGEYVIRDPLSLGPDDSLCCVAEIPEGTLVQVMKGDRDALLSAASDAAKLAREGMSGPLGGAVVFDCVSRCLILKKDITAELAVFQEGLGKSVPMFGCLTFGEVGVLGSGQPQFHNKTVTLLALPDHA